MYGNIKWLFSDDDERIIYFETDSVGLLSYAWFKQLLSGTFVIIHDIIGVLF